MDQCDRCCQDRSISMIRSMSPFRALRIRTSNAFTGDLRVRLSYVHRCEWAGVRGSCQFSNNGGKIQIHEMNLPSACLEQRTIADCAIAAKNERPFRQPLKPLGGF